MNNVMIFVVPALKGGGAEKFVLNLYKAMEKYQGYECHIISIRNNVEHDVSGFRIHFVDEICDISKSGLKRLTYRKKIASAIDNYILFNISKDPIILSNMMMADKVMSKSKLRVFHVIHNSYSMAFLKNRNVFKRIKNVININNIYSNHPLVFISNAVKEDFLLGFDLKSENHIIYNPIDLQEVRSLSQVKMDVSQYGDYIVHIGRFSQVKRHDRLIEAFFNLNNKEINLLLVGDGELTESVVKKVNNFNLQDRVFFVGFEKNPYPLLKNAKGLILCSDYEGLPTVIIEATLLNIPVVTTLSTPSVFEILGSKAEVSHPIHDVMMLSRHIDRMLIEPEIYTCLLDEKFSAYEVSKAYHQLNCRR